MFGNLDNKEIDDLIRSQMVVRIGCHADGITYIIPISYAYEEPYFYCRVTKGQKLDMLRKNPEVCLQLDDTRNLSNWKSVICWGRFEELKADEDKQKAISLLSTRVLPILSSETMHLSPEWPFSGDPQNVPGILFRIKVDKRTGRFERTKAENYFAS